MEINIYSSSQWSGSLEIRWVAKLASSTIGASISVLLRNFWLLQQGMVAFYREQAPGYSVPVFACD